MSGEVGRAVWAFVTFRRWRLGAVLRISRKTHLARGSARIVFWGERTREGECAVAGTFAWVRSDGLVMGLGWVWRGRLLL